MEIKLDKWAQVFRFTISIVATLIIIALAANKVAGIGYRYGVNAGLNECMQQSRQTATNEDKMWLTREYSALATNTHHINTPTQ